MTAPTVETSLQTVLGLTGLALRTRLAIELSVAGFAGLTAFALRRGSRLVGPAGFILISLGLVCDALLHVLPRNAELTVSLEAAGLVLFFFGVIRVAIEAARAVLPGTTQASNIFRDLLMLSMYAVVLMVVLRATARVELTSLLATSAVISVIIGFGLQETLGNIFSGLTLQLQKPFEPGDWVRYGERLGRVEGIGWRATRLITRENERLEIPNNLLSKEVVINYATGAVAENLFIGLPYDKPPNRVKEVLIGVLRGTPGVLTSPEPEINAVEYADSAIRYRLRYWISDYAIAEEVRDSILSHVWYALRRHAIDVPYPTQTIHVHSQRPEEDLKAEQEAHMLAELRQVDLLEGLDDEDLKVLLPNSRVHQFGNGEVLMHEGEVGDFLHILRSGMVEVMARSPSGGMIHIRDLKAPAFFGEIALMTGERRTASIVARSDVEVLELNRQAFSHLFRTRPEALEQVSKIVAQRVSETRERVQSAAEHTPARRDGNWVVARMRTLFDL